MLVWKKKTFKVKLKYQDISQNRIINIGKMGYLLFQIFVPGPIVECFISYFNGKKV